MTFAILALIGTIDATAADADPFAPTGSLTLGFGTLQGESPFLGAEGPSGGLFTSVAEDLVVFRANNGDEAPILGEVLVTELYGGWTLKDQVRIDAFLPLYPYAEAPWSPFQGAAAGDMRLQATIPLVGEQGDAFAFAVVPRLGIPTGKKRGYLARGTHLGAMGAAAGESGKLGWLGNLGLTLSPADEIEGVTLGSTLDLLGGAYYRVDDSFRFGGEVDLSMGLARGLTGQGNTYSTGHLFAQIVLPDGIGLTAGAGSGLIAGIGAPDYRLFAAITYGDAKRDRDKDGLVDDLDACPLDPEDFDQFQDEDGCPEADNDNDGLVDLSDRCPNDPEDFDEFADEDGCPEPDNDQDTVLDGDDECPITFGLVEFNGCPDTDKDTLEDRVDACPEDAGPKKTEGCPDRDDDLVPDWRDACPDEPKPVDEDPATSDGCPKRTYITGSIIKISDQIFFETAKATIKKESHKLLDEVVTVLRKHPWVEKIEVGGHTDDRGSASYNQKLSQARAESVVKYLVDAGIDPSRVVAKGYGEDKPIETNRTEMGRSKNRRVEFVILEQSPPMVAVPKQPTGAAPAPTPPAAPPAATPPPAAPAEASPWTTGDGGAAAAPPAPVGQEPGKLTVTVTGVGWADVYIDDERLPRAAPFRDVEVPAGRHTIVVTNPRAGFEYTEEITVYAGQAITVNATRGRSGDSPWGTTAPPEDDNPWR